MTPLLPAPTLLELPSQFPSPFDEVGPHALAMRAGQVLMAELSRSTFAQPLHAPGAGKMFGVLVVRDAQGTVGFLRAFSGLLGGAWLVDGFAPPLFELAERALVEQPGEATVKRLSQRVEELENGADLLHARQHLADLAVRHGAETSALAEQHRVNKAERHAARKSGAPSEPLEQLSRRDKAARRWLQQRQADELASAQRAYDVLAARLAKWERRRACASRALMRRLFDTYRVTSFDGRTSSLRALYSPHEPPSGAGDCAAPKLLAWAAKLGLQPLALGEFWWGAPPATGGRVEGNWYSACKPKCAPLLPFMLGGLDVAPPRPFDDARTAESSVRMVFEDAWLVVIEKPEGLLSVRGKREDASVQAWLEARGAGWVAHRLDLDTSGLLVAAKDEATFVALQRQFAEREVEKRYVAWVEGAVAGDQGEVSLALRGDVDDRPRQVVDDVHGKPAQTTWRVLERRGARTKLELTPLTGRTHQLRVHCAHTRGLGAPIVGDRLYGREAERLLLHAAKLSFTHPHTKQRVTFESEAPFE